MKYIAVIDTDDYKDFEFFEDADGKYLAVKDKNAKYEEFMALHFTECEQEPCEDMKRKIEKEYLFESLCEDLKKSQAENENLRKALEQEPILGKIKAKIKAYKSGVDRAISEDEFKIEGLKEAYENCLEIIDRYTTESNGGII